ncbi:MAG: P1 family peptidase [Pseudomonadota bacterium]
MTQSDLQNLITDVPGFLVGHSTCQKARSGVTVLRCERQFIATADIRGGAPGTRETDVLDPEKLVGRVDAIVLAGGSVFGLAAGDGVASALSVDGAGLRLSDKGPSIPIVPAAVLHDLGNDGDKAWGETPPYRNLGVKAVRNASKEFELGAVGAGTGAMAGVRRGGIGSASCILQDGVRVGALVAVNPVGSVYMPDGETFYAWLWEQNREFGGKPAPTARDQSAPFPPHARLSALTHERTNTTLAVIATSADLTGVETKRVAIMAQDGIARAIRPAHTPFDGDIVFSVASGETALPALPRDRALKTAEIGAAASDCLARAIARGVYEAERQTAR